MERVGFSEGRLPAVPALPPRPTPASQALPCPSPAEVCSPFPTGPQTAQTAFPQLPKPLLSHTVTPVILMCVSISSSLTRGTRALHPRAPGPLFVPLARGKSWAALTPTSQADPADDIPLQQGLRKETMRTVPTMIPSTPSPKARPHSTFSSRSEGSASWGTRERRGTRAWLTMWTACTRSMLPSGSVPCLLPTP